MKNKAKELKEKIEIAEKHIKDFIKESQDFEYIRIKRKEKNALVSHLRNINWRKSKKVK